VRSELVGGIGVVVPTIVQKDRVDEYAYRTLIRRYIGAGASQLWITGGGGMCPVLGEHTALDVAETCVTIGQGRIPVNAGVLLDEPNAIVDRIRKLYSLGVDAVFVKEPSHYRYRPTELVKYFRRIAEESPLPVILYHHRHQWHCDDSEHIDRVGQLADYPSIIGAKDSIRDFRDHVRVVMKLQTADFRVVGSAGRLLAPSVAVGASGGVFHEAAVAPSLSVRVYRMAAGHQEPIAPASHPNYERMIEALLDLGDAMAAEDPVSALEALSLIDGIDAQPVFPFEPMTERARSRLARALAALAQIGVETWPKTAMNEWPTA
jgi:4-hydroxy-tetrahydrodipicolinate synthase